MALRAATTRLEDDAVTGVHERSRRRDRAHAARIELRALEWLAFGLLAGVYVALALLVLWLRAHAR